MQAPSISQREFSAHDPNALSHSRLTILQRCPRRFYIEYEKGKQRIQDDSQALRMGAAFARALETHNAKTPFTEIYEDRITAAHSQKEIDDYLIESATVEYMAGKYMEIYGPCELREFEYSFPLTDTFKWRGAVDGVMRCKDGKIRGVEDKFLSRWNEKKERNLSLDSQITSEIVGLRSMEYEGVADEILYRVTMKPGIIRRKGRGKDATGAESVAEFVTRITETVEKDIEKYFMEFTVPRFQDEIDAWFQDAQSFAREIESRRETMDFPRAQSTCSFDGGCAHSEICNRIPSAMALYETKAGYPE